MSGWINGTTGAPIITAADYIYPHYYKDLAPGDIIADEVTRRLRATLAPWGGANKLLSWFGSVDRIQRVHLLGRGDYAVCPVLVVCVGFRSHNEVPGKLDVNTVRINVSVVAEATTLSNVLGDGEGSVETIFAYIKRFLADSTAGTSNRGLAVTINGNNISLAKGGVVFGPINTEPQIVPLSQERAAWTMPIDYGVDVDMDGIGVQISQVRSVDPNA